MSSVSSVETSFYPGLIEGFSPKTTEPVPAVKTEEQSQGRGYYSGDDYSSGGNSNVDLSNYYDNIQPEDLLSQAGRNVIRSAQDLDNAMVSALQNGYGVNDACNIRLAELAYRANAFVFEVANEITTFEVDV